MKTAVSVAVVLMLALLAADSSAKPSPTHSNAKTQLPDQASDKAQPPSKPAEVVPPPIPLPPPPVIIPPAVVLFTGGQSSSGSSEAARAVENATETIKTKVASSTKISVITITATRLSRVVTRLRPPGRVGDMEIIRFRFHDRYGRRIGIGAVLCRWAGISRRLCWGEANLPRGTLIALGSSPTRVLGEFAVIGGTGIYTFKQGMMTWSALSLDKFAIRVVLA